MEEEADEDVMATGELNPNHYQAQRAAKVVQHYLNTRYGSPYRLLGLHRVYSGNAEVSQSLTLTVYLTVTLFLLLTVVISDLAFRMLKTLEESISWRSQCRR